MLLLTFPELKQESGEVLEGLREVGATEQILTLWQEMVAMEIEREEDEDEMNNE